MELYEFVIILISIGALFILLSTLKTGRLLPVLKENKTDFNVWRILFFLMIIFFAGYIGSLIFILKGLKEYLILLNGLVFCLGGLFVYIVTRVSSKTIYDLIEKNLCNDLNIELKSSLKQLEDYKHFFYNSHDFSCIANKEGYFEIVNPRWEEALGYSEKEMLSTKFTDFIHPDDVTVTLREVGRLKDGGKSTNFINRYCKKGGGYLWLDWISTYDPASGKIFAVARDITLRINMEPYG
jgi:PAS domain S-box-containing protein